MFLSLEGPIAGFVQSTRTNHFGASEKVFSEFVPTNSILSLNTTAQWPFVPQNLRQVLTSSWA